MAKVNPIQLILLNDVVPHLKIINIPVKIMTIMMSYRIESKSRFLDVLVTHDHTSALVIPARTMYTQAKGT